MTMFNKMKELATMQQEVRRLYNCASDDDTRPVLKGIYQDKKFHMATDGRVAYITNGCLKVINGEQRIIKKTKSLESFDVEAWKLNNVFLDTPAKFPDIKRVLNDNPEYSFMDLTLPEYLSSIKIIKWGQERIYLDTNNNCLALTRPSHDNIISFDIRFLKNLYPFQYNDKKIRIYYAKENINSKIFCSKPLLITEQKNDNIIDLINKIKNDTLKEITFLYVVSPMKL